MNAFWRSLPPGTRCLAAVHAVGFLIVAALGRLSPIDLASHLSLNGSTLHHLQLWRLVTYFALAGDLLGAVFGTLLILFVLPGIERSWSSRRLLRHYLACGAATGLVLVLLPFPLPSLFTNAGALLGMLVPWYRIHRSLRFQLFLGGPEVPAAVGAILFGFAIAGPLLFGGGGPLALGILAALPMSWLLLVVQDRLTDRRSRNSHRPRMGRLEL